MIVATINRTPLAWLMAIIGAERIMGWLPKGTHHYSKLVKPEELTGRAWGAIGAARSHGRAREPLHPRV